MPTEIIIFCYSKGSNLSDGVCVTILTSKGMLYHYPRSTNRIDGALSNINR